MTDNRTTELLQELRDLAADVNPTEIIDHVSITRMGWTFGAQWLDAWHMKFDRIMQAIAATLGSEREKALEELVRDMNAAFIHNNCYRWCEAKEPCNLITDGKCQYRERMQELGVEVIDE